jgi:hypothetical protein
VQTKTITLSSDLRRHNKDLLIRTNGIGLQYQICFLMVDYRNTIRVRYSWQMVLDSVLCLSPAFRMLHSLPFRHWKDTPFGCFFQLQLI